MQNLIFRSVIHSYIYKVHVNVNVNNIQYIIFKKKIKKIQINQKLNI